MFSKYESKVVVKQYDNMGLSLSPVSLTGSIY